MSDGLVDAARESEELIRKWQAKQKKVRRLANEAREYADSVLEFHKVDAVNMRLARSIVELTDALKAIDL